MMAVVFLPAIRACITTLLCKINGKLGYTIMVAYIIILIPRILALYVHIYVIELVLKQNIIMSVPDKINLSKA